MDKVTTFREQSGFDDDVKTKGVSEMKGKKSGGKGSGCSTSNNKLVAGGSKKDGKFASASNGKTMLSSFGGKKGK